MISRPRAISPGRVLLAEDQPVNQRVAMAMLENLGYHVDVVADGVGAVEAAALTHYRAILMDCQLPVLDGYQATEAIRASDTSEPKPGRELLEPCLHPVGEPLAVVVVPGAADALVAGVARVCCGTWV